MASAYVKVFYDFIESTSRLTDAEVGRLVKGMLIYARDGVETEAMIGNESFIFPVFKAQIDRDKAEFEQISEKRRIAGSKGGRKAKEAIASNCKQDKEKEDNKEKDDDNEYMSSSIDSDICAKNDDRMIRFLRENLRSVPNIAIGDIEDLGASEPMVRFAVDHALEHGGQTWGYVRKILQEWLGTGITTVAEAKKYISARAVKKPAYVTGGPSVDASKGYQTHNYTDADFGPDFYYPIGGDD